MNLSKIITFNDIVSRFQGAKPNGNNSVMVKCPCHDDNTQSLCVSEKDGKILFNCFAGCRAEDIVHAIGLQMKDLFPKSNNHSTAKPPSTEYFYGNNLKKIRFYNMEGGEWKKSFCWKHKDSNGNWQKGRNGIKPPLYRQELLSSADGTVYIVEGEKDADTMNNKLNLPTVSPPDGATKGGNNKKWDERFNPLFKGLNVMIVPDNDEAGKNFARIIANELLPIAKSVKIINLADEWSELKEKGDITDIFESEQPVNGKTVAQTVAYKLEILTQFAKPVTAPIPDSTANQETATPESRKEYAPKWVYEATNGRLKLDEQRYIVSFVENQNVKCINDILYSVDGKMTDSKAKKIIINEIMPYVNTNHGDKAEKLLKGIKQYCYTEPPKPTLDKIHFQNGTLSRDKNGLFTVWSDKKEFCINRLAVNYNPNAPIPKKFFDYLSTIYYEDDRKTVQQYCGYCLLPTTIIQKALFIIGEGGEGKSVLGSVLNALFGEENCYNESLSVLQSKFGVANIENKLLFIDDDLSENALTNARTFKNLVTNKTTIAAEKKFVQSNQFKPYVRIIAFGNFTLQSLYDYSEGFSRRQLVLQAKPKDKNRVDNPFIDREIVEEEGEGVMLWIINGLNELIKNNYKIFVSDRTQAKSEELKKQQDSVLCFLEECDSIIINPDLKIHGCELYKIYEEYCAENLFPILKQKTFTQSLKTKERDFGIKYSTNITIKGKRARGFEGIGIGVKIIP